MLRREGLVGMAGIAGGLAAIVGCGTGTSKSSTDPSVPPVIEVSGTALCAGDLALEEKASTVENRRMYRVGSRGAKVGPLGALDAASLLGVPIGAIYEVLRYIVVEDADSVFMPREYDTVIVFEEDAPKITRKGRFQVALSYLAVDNLTEGRLRDSLGGDGGELGLQVAMNKLDEYGRVSHSPAREAEDSTSLFALAEKLLQPTGRASGGSTNARDGNGGAGGQGHEEEPGRLNGRPDTPITGPTSPGSDRERYSTKGKAKNRKKRSAPSKPDLSTPEGRAAAATKVVEDLTNSDFVLSMDFASVRPSAGYSDTAEELFRATPSDDVEFASGVLYEGSIADLDRNGKQVTGISLSTLMLERDDQGVVRALELVRNVAEARDVGVGAYGAEVKLKDVVDALNVIAEKIADDDVELQSFDVRFAPQGALSSGAAPGTRVFELKPCQIVIGRNFHGKEFGAVAVLEIRKL